MIAHKNHINLIQFFPSVASGFLLTWCFPNANLFYLAFLALVPWLISLKSMNAKQSFYSGLVFGIVHFCSLIYWIVPTLIEYGKLHLILAVCALLFLSFYLGLFPAVFAYLLKEISGSFVKPLLASCIWVSLEYIRTYLFSGFAWGALGYSQYLNLILIQIADFSGIYGISFLIILTNYIIADIWISFVSKEQKVLLIPVIYTLVLIVACLFYGANRIKFIDQQIKTSFKPTISIVQGNIDQDKKWSRKFQKQTLEKYISLSTTQIKKKPDLIVWPETALPFYYTYDKKLSEQIDEFIRSSKTNFLIGSLAFEQVDNKIKYYNRAYMLDRFSIIKQSYDKHHLVPFGEYVPFKKYFDFLGKITEQAGNFSIGKEELFPLQFNEYKTGVLICFEILFPHIATKFVKNKADILTTITNDAWFGNTSAAKQHFAIAVLRSVENRRSVVRVANTGISGFINPFGKVLYTTKTFTDKAFAYEIPALKTISFYTKYKDVFAVCTLIVSLFAICSVFVLKFIQKSRSNKNEHRIKT